MATEETRALRFEELGTDALRSLLEGTADGIMVVDSEGTVRYANPAALGMLNRRDLVGTEFGIPLLDGGKAELEVARQGAPPRVLELRAARTLIGAGNVFLVSLHDSTERIEAEQEREKARQEAEAAARTRAALLNMVAHEFRTPLTVIGGYLSMIVDESLGPVPEPWREPLAKVNAKAEELKSMIEEILMAARLEAGRLGRDAELVDLRDVVRAAIRRATGRGALLRAQLRIELPPSPVPADVDPAQIGIVLDNLINNGLTYSEAEEPWLEVRLERSDRLAVVSVSDHGYGIPAELQGAIFERFRRADTVRGEPRPGTGLGLAIARDLAQLNGGELRLDESVPGRGSRFVLELPVPS